MKSIGIKSAIVTGASRGIGRAIAARLAADGFGVVINYASNRAHAEEAVAEFKGKGQRAIAVMGNVADLGDMQRMFDAAQQEFGRIDVVVHNAGIMKLGPIGEGTLATFDQVIGTNLRGSFVVLGLAAKHLKEGGRIIALSSSVIAKSFPQYGPYIASKEGVEGLVRVLANELRGRGITANAIAPGPVRTELFLEGKSEQLLDQLSKLSPLERLGEPEDISRAVSFLAGADGGWVNGQVLRVNGGMA